VKLVTAVEALQLDKKTQGLVSLDLMEEAGCSCARWIDHFLSQHKSLKSEPLHILCGSGNNGGDGFVIARALHEKGYLVKVYLVQGVPRSSQAQKKYESLPISPENQFPKSLRGVVIDAIFGVGFRPPLEASVKSWLQLANQTALYRIAIDTPTGLDSTEGLAEEETFHAHTTLTIAFSKTGFYLRQGPGVCGKVKVLTIGFPEEIKKSEVKKNYLMQWAQFSKWLPQRSEGGNKSHFGHSVIVAGSEGKWGAALLSTRAAFRTGSGYVTLASQESMGKFILESPDVMSLKWGDLLSTIKNSKKFMAFAVGPGLGVKPQQIQKTSALLELLYQEKISSVVLDADALTALAKMKSMKLLPTWVLTPNSGELARLLNVSVAEIDQRPLYYSKLAAQKFECIVLLKGFHTVISQGDRSIFIPTGNAALAKAGSGDVLTGCIASFMAQGLCSLKAACLGAYLHGSIADEWIKTKDIASLSAKDLLEELPKIMYRLRGINAKA